MFFGRNDAKAETAVLWPPHAKSWLIGKDSDAGRDWGQEEKRMIEDEMAGWHHQLYGREFEWTLGVGNGQGGLVCCDSWGRKESDTTERLNWTELNAHMCVHVWLFVTLWTVVQQGPLSMGYFRQEYWSELPFSSSRESSWPGDWTHISVSPALQADSLPTDIYIYIYIEVCIFEALPGNCESLVCRSLNI